MFCCTYVHCTYYVDCNKYDAAFSTPIPTILDLFKVQFLLKVSGMNEQSIPE